MLFYLKAQLKPNYIIFGFFLINFDYFSTVLLKNNQIISISQNNYDFHWNLLKKSINYVFRLSNKKKTFLLRVIKTPSFHHFEAYEYLVKICEDQLSTHNQTKLLTGLIIIHWVAHCAIFGQHFLHIFLWYNRV